MNGSGLIQRMLGGPMMELPSTAFIKTLRRWLADLEYLEATGAATPDTCEVLVELHELLDKLYTTMAARARKTLQ